MKSPYSLSMLAAAALIATTLAGCAASQSQRPQQSQGSMGSMDMSNADSMAMCKEMHTQMMNAKTPEERQAMMAEHMKNMSPEMMQHCPMMQGQQGGASTK
ncbi:hypothetical protein [Oxalicibacterium solurbis]|uniref:Uncharacterized protein n=1 Tax=Oxalicibacterium solurbis TaxID=69280 RepID=A0A8J3AZC1_9BURK|nr:hypothetical protein [Oxalicibacterium solurbis]GGI55672.1 hypothetical protein GCM10011430_28460 [Oxalicibacterium solurbis]